MTENKGITCHSRQPAFAYAQARRAKAGMTAVAVRYALLY